jgi:hypothetical protein
MPANHPTLRATARACTCGHGPSNKSLFVRYRKSEVPEGGWTYENFVGPARDALRADMLLMRRAALARGLRTTANDLEAVMKDHVTRTLDTALGVLSRLYGVPIKTWRTFTKADFDFEVPNEAGLWADAIEQEMAAASTQVTGVMTPAINSVGGDVYEKVGVLLGSKPTRAQITSLGVPMREIASRVGNVTNHTRNMLRNYVAHSIRNNYTVFETADYIRSRVPSLATNRVPTIVRTELGMAADEAIKKAMHDGGTVTHFDVIGCEAVEPGIPTWNGFPTCNIKGVPMTARGHIRFHPNHTGCIVPSAFRRENGDVPNITPRGGVGEGVPEGG